MLKKPMFISKIAADRTGQNLLEYTIIIGIVTTVLIAMSTYIQRGTQGMIRVVADQVGLQQDSEQHFNSETSGYLVRADSEFRAAVSKETRDSIGVFNYVYDDSTAVSSNQIVDLGFLEKPVP